MAEGDNLGAGYTNTAAGGGTGADGKVKIFVIILIILHLYDIFSGFNRIGARWAQWGVIYGFVALVAAPLVFDEGQGFARSFMNFKKTIVYVVVSALALMLPVLLDLLPQSITTIRGFSFLVMLSPVWVLYVFFSGAQDPVVVKMRNIWLFIWIFLLIITAIGAVADLRVTPELQGQYRFDPMDALDDVWNSVKTSWKRIIESLTGIPATFTKFINTNLNESLDRGYRGEVDDSSPDLGVEFTEIRPFQQEFYEGQKIVIWANVRGESFKEIIRLSLGCRAVGNDRDGTSYTGVIVTNGEENQNEILIKGRQTLGVRCEFENLPVGYYDVELAGTFNFETWSYVHYYFAPYELIESMWQQDVDPAQEADIDARPTAIYTNGPVNLGISSLIDQPVPVDPTDPLPSVPYGASVINQWADGKVQSVRFISLLVPEPFILEYCDQLPAPGQGTSDSPQWTIDEETGYREYTFGNIGNDANSQYQSATCFLGLDGGVGGETLTAQRVVGGYDLVMKTFAAKTGYLYTIEGRESIQVRKRGDIY